MDIKALSQIAGAGSSASAVAVPADSRAMIREIAASTRLSETQKTSLVAAVAAADSGLADRSAALARAQMLGLYLRNTGNDGFPRWSMMTALRAYGMNLTESAAAPAAMQQALQSAVAETQVSVETAVAVARTMAPPPTPAPTSAPKAAAKAPAADVPVVAKVEKFV